MSLLRSSPTTKTSGGLSQYQQPSIAFATSSATTNSNSSNSTIIVHQTSDVELDERYPAILEYRQRWHELGFHVEVTPGRAIRADVERMQSPQLLHVFDRLPTNVLKYDFWRYVILYLEGGVYADVDCEPFAGVREAIQRAHAEDKVFLFSETDIFDAFPRWMQWFVVALTNVKEIPQYSNFLMVAPHKEHFFFKELLQAIDPDQWMHLPEPKRTLILTGPGHLTVFARERLAAGQTDVILGHYKISKASFLHHCFGSWKTTTTYYYEFYFLPGMVYVVPLAVVLFAFRVLVRRRVCTGKLKK